MDRPDHPQNSGTEWLLTDGLGGFAMGTASGLLTRRYHGLLIAAMKPPVERVVLVSQVVERLVVDGEEHWLTPMRFVGREPDAGPVEFETGWRETTRSVVWRFERGGVRIEKELHRAVGHAAAMLTYRINADRPGFLELRPLVALRDFHDLRTAASEPVVIHADGSGVAARSGTTAVHISSSGCMRVDEREDWANLLYAVERDRAQDCIENLVMPCRFVVEFAAGATEAVLDFSARPNQSAIVLDIGISGLDHAIERVSGSNTEAREAVARLAAAADQFVVKRGDGGEGVSIIAGYPWFADWGRDTMISLPGLLLATGRFDEALNTLRVYAGALKNGLIPNRFDDYAGGAHYNTVDASLWFLHAAAAYRGASGDDDGYREHLAGPCRAIIAAYRNGTDYGIRMDTDGLITAGSPDTQLTWMDAQRDGVTFTPRFGKCVEINALWHHGLVRTAAALEADEPEAATELRTLAARVAASFMEWFPDPSGGLFDRLEPVGSKWLPIAEIRPNQIFAASLSESPADEVTRASIIGVVRKHLLTPFGLRTLAPSDPNYIGSYKGSLFERDRAYHNGTVWPWLIGPYVEAFLRLGGDQGDARDLLRPLTARLDSFCIGQISEVCDGDAPHRPDGCPAQAWSVAELLRSWMLVASE